MGRADRLVPRMRPHGPGDPRVAEDDALPEDRSRSRPAAADTADRRRTGPSRSRQDLTWRVDGSVRPGAAWRRRRPHEGGRTGRQQESRNINRGHGDIIKESTVARDPDVEAAPRHPAAAAGARRTQPTRSFRTTEGRCMRQAWAPHATTHTPATKNGGQQQDSSNAVASGSCNATTSSRRGRPHERECTWSEHESGMKGF